MAGCQNWELARQFTQVEPAVRPTNCTNRSNAKATTSQGRKKRGSAPAFRDNSSNSYVWRGRNRNRAGSDGASREKVPCVWRHAIAVVAVANTPRSPTHRSPDSFINHAVESRPTY